MLGALHDKLGGVLSDGVQQLVLRFSKKYLRDFIAGIVVA